MKVFEDGEREHSGLSGLEKREPPMVTVLPRQPGTKEARYAHLLGAAAPVAPSALAHATAARDHDAAAPSSSERIEALVAEVAELRSQISDLQLQFATFRKQFE